MARTPRRRLLTGTILTLAGVIANMAVAYACCILASSTPAYVHATEVDEAWFRANVPIDDTEGWQIVPTATTVDSFGTHTRVVAAMKPHTAILDGAYGYRTDCGWPAASLRFSSFAHVREQ